jgi:hypothetical protein
MDVDRHKLWRIVANNVRTMNEDAPEGYEATVEVFLVDRPNPVPLAQVQTHRSPEFPWTLLIGTDRIEGEWPTHLVFAPEQYVERVEVRLVRSEGPSIGFRHRVLEDADTNPEASADS